MSDEQNKSTATPAANVEAEKDVQNVLGELKAEEKANKEQDAKPAESEAAKKEDNSAEGDEEARIIAAAAKMGQDSEKAEGKANSVENGAGRGNNKKSHGGGRFGRGGRTDRPNRSKFDPSSQKPTNDPVEIKKQVWLVEEISFARPFFFFFFLVGVES